MIKPRILWCGEFSQLKTGYSVYAHEVLSRWHSTGKYEIAEHACYAHHSDPRIRNVPWVVYGNLPDQDNKEQQQRYVSSPTAQFGDWRFEEICLDFRPHIVCTPPGSLVLTINGYVPIEDITIGDCVATHTGKFKKVTKTFKRQYRGNLHYISFNGCNESLKLTPDHPVLIYKKRKQTNQKKSFNKIYENISPEFVSAKDIKNGDLIILPDFNQKYIEHQIDISEYLSQYILEDGVIYTKSHNEKCNTLPQNITINYDFGVILGYIIGDGHISKSGVSITLTGDEEEYVKEIKEIFKSKFNLYCSVTPDKDKYAITVNINSVLLSEFLTNFNYKIYIWNNQEFVKGLIRGLVRSDGCYKKNTVSFCSKNKSTAHLFRILCWMLQIPTCIHKNNNEAYEVEGYGESARLLHQITKKHNDIYTPNSIKPLKRIQIINNHLVSSITKNRTVDYYGQVYNIEVEEDNSYIIQQSCVHNCDIRDYWMMNHQYRSPFRVYYNLCQMPTCDAYPQNEEWISSYGSVDGIFTYQDWSKQVLDFESAGKINTLGSASPAAAPEFQPMDQAAIKKSLGLENCKIIGTVMRNQRRKLFPDLFGSFKVFLEQTKRSDILLYCHTSYPDMGWDMPKLLLQYGLSSKVLFTYVCKECGNVQPEFFNDALMHCKRCGKLSSSIVNVQQGVDNRVLAAIYNMMDLYIQWANSEGFALPVIEAAACGTPVISVDYSAISDNTRKISGVPIKPLALYMELETGCFRAVPNNDKLIDKMIEFFEKLNEDSRQQLRSQTRQAYLQNYSWDITAQKWMNYFDSVNVQEYENRWFSEPRYTQVPNDYPRHLSNPQFARWLILNVLGEPRYVNSYMESRLIRDLNYEVTNMGIAGMYFNDQSAMFSKPQWQPFNQEAAFKHFVELGNRKNYWENIKWQKIQQLRNKGEVPQ